MKKMEKILAMACLVGAMGLAGCASHQKPKGHGCACGGHGSASAEKACECGGGCKDGKCDLKTK